VAHRRAVSNRGFGGLVLGRGRAGDPRAVCRGFASPYLADHQKRINWMKPNSIDLNSIDLNPINPIQIVGT
jgi:hypothetical protein